MFLLSDMSLEEVPLEPVRDPMLQDDILALELRMRNLLYLPLKKQKQTVEEVDALTESIYLQLRAHEWPTTQDMRALRALEDARQKLTVMPDEVSGIDTARQNVVDRLRKKVGDRPFECLGKQLTVTVSIGLSFFSPETPKNAEAVIQEADLALFASKNNGRNVVSVYPYI